ncbi:MAG TPA: hypothetical protein DCW31_04915 [Lactobacillus sp.]|nr:hypothetical protein [Lactobacillus sp.]
MKTMASSHFGDVAVLQEERMPVPEVGDNDLLVRVEAAAINPLDYQMITGQHDRDLGFPLVLGRDVAGQVVGLGAHVQLFNLGDEVVGYQPEQRCGTFAEYAVIPANQTLVRPHQVSAIQAATLPTSGETAYEAIVDTLKLHNEQTILIHGGAGGVGSFAVQIAHLLGAHVITTVPRRDEKYGIVLGADQAIDYQVIDFRQVIQPVDAILDTVGSQVLTDSMWHVRRGGHLVSVESAPDLLVAEEGAFSGDFFKLDPNVGVLGQLLTLVAKRQIQPLIEKVIPFTAPAIREALKVVGSGHERGKRVISVWNPQLEK